MTSLQTPRFRITLERQPSRHMLEQSPRYDVLVNGKKVEELTYNMRGYVGYLPTITGAKMDIGERAISAFRKEATVLNREAERLILVALHGERRIAHTWPTSDGTKVFALARDEEGTNSFHLLSRREVLEAEKLFGTREIGIGFFEPYPFTEEGPTVLFTEVDRALQAGLPDVPSRIMDAVVAERHERRIEHVCETADPMIRLVISRRIVDGADAEPEYVTRGSLDLARIRFGDAMRLSDLATEDRCPAITRDEDRAMLRRDFTWFDVDGRPAAVQEPAAKAEGELEMLAGPEDMEP